MRYRKELAQSVYGHGIVLAIIGLVWIISPKAAFRHEKYVTVNLRGLAPGLPPGPAGPATKSSPPISAPVNKPAPPAVQTPKAPQKQSNVESQKSNVTKAPQNKVQELKAQAKPVPVAPTTKPQAAPPSLSDRLKNRLAQVSSVPSSSKTSTASIPSNVFSNKRFVEPGEWSRTQTNRGGAQTQISAGSGGGGGGFGKEFPFSWYVDLVQSKITSNWKEPPKTVSQNDFAIVSFTVSRNGDVSRISFAQKSNDQALNDSIMQALQTSNPLPPLPDDYPENTLSVKIKFELVN